MFATQEESDFLLKHIQKHHSVLEYGSGNSTLEISKLCDKLISIEHQKDWYEYLITKIDSNTKLILKEPNESYIEGTLCGTYNQFRDYITCPVEYGKFDIILIDGRARIECAKSCKKMAKSNTLVFIHDFTSRLEIDNYKEVFNYLEIIESVGDMSKFKIKI